MLRFIDSFDHYTTADLNFIGNGSKYNMTIFQNNTGTASIFPSGRFGSCLRMGLNINSNEMCIVKSFDNQASWIIGFAYRTSLIQQQNILSLKDYGTAQVEVSLTATGTLNIKRNGTVLGTSITTISANVWNYIELKVTIASSISANTCRLNLNSINVINISAGTSTKNSANSTANQICIGHATAGNNVNGCNADYDDLYICDGTGSINNNFLGDVRVEARLPNANGTNTAWAGSYVSINNPMPIGDASFLSDATSNHISTFTIPPISSSPATIFGVAVTHDCRKSDAGIKQVADEIRSSGTNYVGSTVNLNIPYTINQNIWETDPATSIAWTASGVNNVEIGLKVI